MKKIIALLLCTSALFAGPVYIANEVPLKANTNNIGWVNVTNGLMVTNYLSVTNGLNVTNQVTVANSTNVIGSVKITDGADQANVDGLVGGLMVIDTVHHEVHEGITFRYCSISNIADNGNFVYILQTGSMVPHVTASVASEGAGTIIFCENAIYTNAAGVRTNTLVNMNRGSTNLATTKLITFVVVTNYGTQLCRSLILGSTGPRSVGSDVRQDTEFMLKTNTTYAIIASNYAGGAKLMNINVQWYEEE